jgi:dipeptidyl aminopeptidase/acylaminoacyl peptidase
MEKTMKKRKGILSLLLVLSIAVAVADAAPPPIAAFARLEQLRSLSLSPDGKYLAFISQSQGKRIAMTMAVDVAGAAPKLVMTSDKDGNFDLTWCRWAKNSRLLCGFVAPIEQHGRVFRISRLVAVNADGSGMKVLLQNSPVVMSNSQQDNILDRLPDSTSTVLIQTYESLSKTGASIGYYEAQKFYPAVFELDIYSGQLKKHTPARPPISQFQSDGHGNVRFGSGLEGTAMKYFARRKDESEWRELAKIEVQSLNTASALGDFMVPLSVIPESNQAYALGPMGDRKALFQIDLEDRGSPKLIFEHPRVDIGGVVRDSDGALLAVSYDTDRPFVYYMESKMEALLAGVKKALPDTFNTIVSASRDRTMFVIAARSDVNAGVYYLFDAASGQLTRLGSVYPELDPASMARQQSIEYKATDGVAIPGYLSVPVGVRAEKLPLIVMPHGGPEARDYWRFDFLRSFLTSRGYAVLQMNFRGSSGYGTNWLYAAKSDWGGLTHSDVRDAATWAVEKGIADPQRMCIVGWSFGGYEALLGAVRDHDLYRCAASIAGVSDLAELKKTIGNVTIANRRIGRDDEKLERDSPAQNAALVKMPVLMVHGTLDAQAPFEQSKDMAAALKKADKDFKFVVIENGDHGLVRESERTVLLTELEKFLQTHLGQGSVANN